jgi:hypothetical protein
MRTITKSALATLALLCIAATGASAAAAALPSIPAFNGPAGKHNPVVKPSEIVYSGDGSQLFGGPSRKSNKIHWTTWNSTEGVGTGAQWIDNCNPNCAAGTFTRYPISLKATQPKKEGKYLIFTRLKVTYTTSKHFANKKSFTWKVSYEAHAHPPIFVIG